MHIKVATWNINSVRLRLPLVLRFLAEEQPDLLCLQEIKARAEAVPREALASAGYPWAVMRGEPGCSSNCGSGLMVTRPPSMT